MSMWVRTRDGARNIHVVRVRVRASPVWFELSSSYVSYLVVSAGTDLAGAIMARAVSGSTWNQTIIYNNILACISN